MAPAWEEAYVGQNIQSQQSISAAMESLAVAHSTTTQTGEQCDNNELDSWQTARPHIFGHVLAMLVIQSRYHASLPKHQKKETGKETPANEVRLNAGCLPCVAGITDTSRRPGRRNMILDCRTPMCYIVIVVSVSDTWMP